MVYNILHGLHSDDKKIQTPPDATFITTEQSTSSVTVKSASANDGQPQTPQKDTRMQVLFLSFSSKQGTFFNQIL